MDTVSDVIRVGYSIAEFFLYCSLLFLVISSFVFHFRARGRNSLILMLTVSSFLVSFILAKLFSMMAVGSHGGENDYLLIVMYEIFDLLSLIFLMITGIVISIVLLQEKKS